MGAGGDALECTQEYGVLYWLKVKGAASRLPISFTDADSFYFKLVAHPKHYESWTMQEYFIK
jgi:hypothetical protein